MTTAALHRWGWGQQRALLLAGALGPLLAAWAVSPVWILAAIIGTVSILGILRYPILGFVLLAFAVPWGGDFTVSAGSFPVTPTEPIVALLAFVLAVRAVAYRENPLTPAWTPWIALFLAAIAISASQATDMRASERELVKWLELVVVYLAGCAFIRTRRDVHLVIAAIVAAGVSQALLGFFQSGLSLGPATFAAQRAFLRAYGTFDQPNPYAGYLNLVLPLAIAVALRGGLTRAARRLYWIAAILIGGAVLASESRAGLLAGAVGVAIMLALVYRRMLQAALLGILAGIGGIFLATFDVLPLGPIQKVLTSLGLGNVAFNDVTDANFSAVERAAHWLAGVRMFQAHPILGVGIGNYSAAYPAFHPRGWYASLDHAHNYYINISAEAGIIGLTAYILLVGSALWYGYVALRPPCEGNYPVGVTTPCGASPLFRAAGLGVTGALVATSIHNTFDVLYVHGITALLGLLMALTAGAASTSGTLIGALLHRTSGGFQESNV